MVSRFYAYEMQIYMNVGMLNIFKSCFNVHSLFFFSFGGFDVLSFCTFDIQLLDDVMYYKLIHKHYENIS